MSLVLPVPMVWSIPGSSVQSKLSLWSWYQSHSPSSKLHARPAWDQRIEYSGAVEPQCEPVAQRQRGGALPEGEEGRWLGWQRLKRTSFTRTVAFRPRVAARASNAS